ncbi:toxin VasX, partial [Providencia alcalifaciens]|uniref:toxin VasX n=1 Tax=Providencia alcalifaciens TaxID=126385 RepID=UPI0032D9D164
MILPINNNLVNIVDKANSVFADSDDITKISSPCYRNIRPVYPVRYAYMNFFTKDLYKPQLPPSIQDLMDATSLEQVGGYTARILREGWVYVKEEAPLKTRGSQSENGILIFKHILNEIESEKEGDIASVSEIFYEYEFNNENNSYQEKKQVWKPCGF